MFLVVGSLIVGVLGIGWFYLLNRDLGRIGSVLTGLSALPASCVPLFGVNVQLFFLGLVGLLIGKDATRRTRLTLALCSSVATYSFTLAVSLPRYFEARQLQQENPVTSLEKRLAYETRPYSQVGKREIQPANDEVVDESALAHADQADSTNKGTSDLELLGDEPANRLKDKLYSGGGFSGREFALQRLHRSHQAEFVSAGGFGLVRTMSVRRKHVELPKTRPVPLRASQAEKLSHVEIDGVSAEAESGAAASSVDHPDRDTLLFTHDLGAIQFLDIKRMGYVRNRAHTVGFQPHAFQNMLPPTRLSYGITTRWRITSLQLVSLLKFDEPRVYDSNHLPNMELLQTVETRLLTDFEKDALPQLRYKQDLVVEEHADRIEMLGALRAGQKCIDCHHVDEGALLGAFSYVLRPMADN